MIVFLLLILFSFLLAAFFAGTETAFITLFRKREFIERTTVSMKSWLDAPERLFSVTLIGTNIFIVVASSLTTYFFVRSVGAKGEIYSLIVVSIFALVFCEVLPKSWALAIPERFARTATPLLNFWGIVLKPLSYITNKLSIFALSSIRKFFPEAESFRMGELEQLARDGKLDIGSDKNSMLLLMLDLSKKTAFDFIIPKGRLAHVIKKTSVETAIERARTSGITEFVVETENGEIEGIAKLSDLISLPGFLVDDAAQPPFFVPEKAPILKVFAELPDSESDIALAVDEHGTITGAIKYDDIIDYLSGRQFAGHTKLKEGEAFIAHGSSLIEEIEFAISKSIPQGPYRTLAGFIEETAGNIPEAGYTKEWNGLIFTVIESDKRTIKKIKIEPIQRQY